MKRRICVKSMVLGAVIMLIGLAVGCAVSPSLIAQRNSVFDKITCREIEVVDKDGLVGVRLGSDGLGNRVYIYNKQGKTAMVLGSGGTFLGNSIDIYNKQEELAVVLGSEDSLNRVYVFNKQGTGVVGRLYNTEYGGSVDVFNNQRKGSVLVTTDEHGGAVAVFNNQKKLGASVSVAEHGGRFDVYNNQGKNHAAMGVNEYGGHFDVYNNQGKGSATMAVNEYGNGAVSTWDKNGYRQ